MMVSDSEAIGDKGKGKTTPRTTTQRVLQQRNSYTEAAEFGDSSLIKWSFN